MSIYLSLLIAGFGGGVVRGLVGFIKNQYAYKTSAFNLPYFLVMAFLSGVVGLLVSLSVFSSDLEGTRNLTSGISFIVGYAGGDFLESAWKIIAGKVK